MSFFKTIWFALSIASYHYEYVKQGSWANTCQNWGFNTSVISSVRVFFPSLADRIQDPSVAGADFGEVLQHSSNTITTNHTHDNYLSV